MEDEDSHSKKADRSSARIIINNTERKIFVQYRYVEKGNANTFFKEITGLYETMVDPYINFSDYSLGIGKNNKSKNIFSFDYLEEEGTN